MRINLTINDELLAKAQSVSHISNKKILIETALRLLVTIESQKDLLNLWGKIEVDEAFR